MHKHFVGGFDCPVCP